MIPSEPDPEDLLAHRDFVRAMAGAVLGADERVDDVEQETWLAALRHAPSIASVRAWLGAVSRNRAYREIRSATRRSVRERSAHQARQAPDPAEIIEREETRRRLLSAVVALGEPYRAALLLRYYEGLRPPQIARRLDVPIETVRTRLRRGLAQLRRSLAVESERPGRGGLAALALLAVEPTKSILVLGGLAMSTTTKISLAAVAVGLLVLSSWLVLGALRSSERSDDRGGDALRSPSERLAEQPPELHGRPAPAAPRPAPEAGEPAAPWTCTFQTHDADQSPRRWMGAALQDRHGNTLESISPETGPAFRGVLKVRGSGYLVVWAHQRLPWRSEWLEPPPSRKRHLVVQFDPGLAVSGTVFEQDGVTPLSGGTVDSWSFAMSHPRRPASSSRDNIVQKDGHFSIPGLPPGPVKLEAKAHDFTKGRKVKVDAQAGDDDLRLVLGPQGAIAFLIVDEATGAVPQTKSLRVFGVTDAEERMWTRSTRSVLGEAREARPSSWHRAEPGRTYHFRVEALGYEPSELVAVTVPVTGGKQVVRIALRSAPDAMARLTVTLRTSGGELPEWIYVRRYLSLGSSNTRGVKIEGGQIVLELIPGPQHLEMGRAPTPDPEDEHTFLVPVEVKLTLSRGEERDVQVLLEKGGWVVVEGDPDPRPREVRLLRGEQVIDRHAEWGPWGKEHRTAYKLGVLPPGTWTLEYKDRKHGRRARFEVEPGKVTRLDPKTFNTFIVDDE